MYPVMTSWVSRDYEARSSRVDLTISIPKEISVGTFRYDFFGGKPYFPQKGGNGPLLEEKGGTSPLFDRASPPFAEKRSSLQISNTDRKY
jgi:hypothetical protein